MPALARNPRCTISRAEVGMRVSFARSRTHRSETEALAAYEEFRLEDEPLAAHPQDPPLSILSASGRLRLDRPRHRLAGHQLASGASNLPSFSMSASLSTV